MADFELRCKKSNFWLVWTNFLLDTPLPHRQFIQHGRPPSRRSSLQQLDAPPWRPPRRGRSPGGRTSSFLPRENSNLYYGFLSGGERRPSWRQPLPGPQATAVPRGKEPIRWTRHGGQLTSILRLFPDLTDTLCASGSTPLWSPSETRLLIGYITNVT